MKSFNMYSARLALLLFCSFAIISNLSIVSCSVLITILGLSDGIIKSPFYVDKVYTPMIYSESTKGIHSIYTYCRIC